jgi:hypothetical protein
MMSNLNRLTHHTHDHSLERALLLPLTTTTTSCWCPVTVAACSAEAGPVEVQYDDDNMTAKPQMPRWNISLNTSGACVK